jgi:hypothetical protein
MEANPAASSTSRSSLQSSTRMACMTALRGGPESPPWKLTTTQAPIDQQPRARTCTECGLGGSTLVDGSPFRRFPEVAGGGRPAGGIEPVLDGLIGDGQAACQRHRDRRNRNRRAAVSRQRRQRDASSAECSMSRTRHSTDGPLRRMHLVPLLASAAQDLMPGRWSWARRGGQWRVAWLRGCRCGSPRVPSAQP